MQYILQVGGADFNLTAVLQLAVVQDVINDASKQITARMDHLQTFLLPCVQALIVFEKRGYAYNAVLARRRRQT